jgi:hypothetical protein
LKDQRSPKIGISIHGNGIADERDGSGTVVARRLQVIVSNLTDASLVGCQAEIERVERIDSRGSILLDDSVQVEWSNVDEAEKYRKITIPAGTRKRANVFAIVPGAPLFPVIQYPKQELIEGTARPGKYHVSLVS